MKIRIIATHLLSLPRKGFHSSKMQAMIKAMIPIMPKLPELSAILKCFSLIVFKTPLSVVAIFIPPIAHTSLQLSALRLFLLLECSTETSN